MAQRSVTPLRGVTGESHARPRNCRPTPSGAAFACILSEQSRAAARSPRRLSVRSFWVSCAEPTAHCCPDPWRARRLYGAAGSRGRAAASGAGRGAAQPPALQPLAAGGIVGGALGGSSFVGVSAAQRSGLVVVAPALLRFPYHVRYELIEFAVYCLAARAQRLVPLHAACVAGHRGAALLLGASGAGKSTIMLHSLLSGLEFLAEDSVLVRPRGLLATGVANYLHLRADSLHFVRGTPLARAIRAAGLIQRRSGVRKYELDLRRRDFRLVRAPVRLRALVFLSARPARGGRLLRALPAARWRRGCGASSPMRHTSRVGRGF